MEIDEKIIEKLLIEKNQDKTIKVRKITQEPAVGKGENFMSVAMKIQVYGTKMVDHKTVDFSKSLFMKKQFENKEATQMLQSDQIFGNEALAYNEIIPILEQYLGEELAVPKCYRADQKHLILENLFAEGYGMIESQKSLTIDQCYAVLKELAKFHAASYILKAKDLKKFEELSGKFYEWFAKGNAMAGFCEQGFESTIRQLKIIKPETVEIKNILEKLEKVRKTIVSDVIELLEKKTETDIFNHGDCWMNNLLFKNVELTTKGVKTTEILVKLVDLQIMRLTSPAADLNYFLYINLFPALRKEKTDILLSFYLQHLHTNLKKHNLTNLIKILDLNWLKNEMSRFSKLGLMFGLMIFPIFYINKQEIPEMESITKEKIENPDEEIEEWMTESNNEEYHKALIEFLRIYFEKYDI